jgi:Zn-dependent alcohol dehydrogenase
VGRELDLAQVNEGLDLLRDGSVIGRVVVHP